MVRQATPRQLLKQCLGALDDADDAIGQALGQRSSPCDEAVIDALNELRDAVGYLHQYLASQHK